MIVTGYFSVYLPVNLYIKNEFYNTELTKFEFTIADIKCKFVLSSNNKSIEKISLIVPMEYDDEKYPIWTKDSNNNFVSNEENEAYARNFISEMEYYVAIKLQDFLDGYSKSSNQIPYRIHDGESLSTKYSLSTEPPISTTNYDGDDYPIETNTINDKELMDAIAYAEKEKDYFDTAWQILLDIDSYIEIGKLEISLLQMATLLELLISTPLSQYLDNFGNYTDPNHSKATYKKKFYYKYYQYGFNLLGYKPLTSDLLNSIDVIYETRNKLIHRGYRLRDVPLFKNSGIHPYQFKSIVHDLKNDCIEVHNILKEYTK